jgi:hypothetical protein
MRPGASFTWTSCNVAIHCHWYDGPAICPWSTLQQVALLLATLHQFVFIVPLCWDYVIINPILWVMIMMLTSMVYHWYNLDLACCCAVIAGQTIDVACPLFHLRAPPYVSGLDRKKRQCIRLLECVCLCANIVIMHVCL